MARLPKSEQELSGIIEGRLRRERGKHLRELREQHDAHAGELDALRTEHAGEIALLQMRVDIAERQRGYSLLRTLLGK